ncbi:MAG TPA: diguanylate cyclase, partial [Nitrospirota bacterium]
MASKVLIVDDDKDIAFLVKSTLAAPDREFVFAADGVDAVEKTLTEMPDLIVLDVMMPRMNGYQVCRLLKNDKNTWEIPILILTAKTKEKDRYYGKSVGADDYITKPFLPAELRQRANELLERSSSRGKVCPVAAPAEAEETNLLSRVNSLLDKKLQEMTFLQYMTKAIVGTFDEEKILKTVLRGINTQLAFSRVAAYIMETGGVLVLRDQIGLPDAENLSLEMQEEALSKLLFGREFVILGREDLPKSAGLRGSVQVCYIPVLFRDIVRGVIIIERKFDEPPFSDERIGLLVTLASQLGLALDNAAMYRKTLLLSITDGLTGLFNSRYFYEKLDAEISRARRYGHPLSLFMLDVDFFKKFNDSFGHLSGDEALKHISRLLRQHTRDTDVIARYGGEEFCI